MLESLYIRNLVLVPELQLDFTPGFITVTGETGAGKSLVIGALGLLSGRRASANVISHGATQCEVAGVFRLPEHYAALRKRLEAQLEELGLPPLEDGRLMLRRLLSANGSRAFVNGSPVTAGVLRSFGEALVDIHGPNENQTLLLPAKQLELLDAFGGYQPLLEQTAASWNALSAIRARRKELEAAGLAPEELPLLAHQLEEIDRAELHSGEEESLSEEHRKAAGVQRLCQLSGELAGILGQNDDSLVDSLSGAIRAAEELAEIDPRGCGEYLQRLNALSEELSELSGELQDYNSSLELDGETLQRLEERMGLLQALKRRYGPTYDDVMETGERIRKRIANATGRVAELEALQKQESEAKAHFMQSCGALSEARREAAGRLAAAISEKLKRLGFLKAAFEIRLQAASAPAANGADACEFFLSPNPGEPLAPLREVASSGEIARVMLAIKTVLSDADELPIMVFDEIDANIGGRTAAVVGTELQALGCRHQVFSITHLPLIAASGNSHYLVEKRADGERTTTAMQRVDGDARVVELVRMLGAAADDAAAIAHAREMLAAQQAGF